MTAQNVQNEASANVAIATGNGARNLLGTLTEVASDLKTSTGRAYGRAKFTYVNGFGDTKTLTMLAFGKGYENVKSIWKEGYSGHIYCRYEDTDKGTTMRAINKGRAPVAKAAAIPQEQPSDALVEDMKIAA